MRVDVVEETIAALEDYARIPIAFAVDQVFDVAVSSQGSGKFVLTERRLLVPYIKDYDAAKGEGPTQWAGHFDMSNWGFFAAWMEGRRVGGSVVAFNTPGLKMLEGRTDLAVLWDIRVSPEARKRGVGSALFLAAEGWARAKGCRQLKVETQNINVAACRFYMRQGCALAAVDRLAYSELPDEIRLLWCKDLSDKAEFS
jgi:GNAT superfamily N-acetyltransferase